MRTAKTTYWVITGIGSHSRDWWHLNHRLIDDVLLQDISMNFGLERALPCAKERDCGLPVQQRPPPDTDAVGWGVPGLLHEPPGRRWNDEGIREKAR